MCSDYRLFQPKEHLSCQHLRYKLLPHDRVLFEFHRKLHFMSKSYSSSNVRKAAHPAGHTVWGFLRVYKATWGTFLHVILFSFSFHFCPLIPSTSQNWLNWDITHSAETATTEMLTCSPIKSHFATYHCTFFGTILSIINVFENYRPIKTCYDIQYMRTCFRIWLLITRTHIYTGCHPRNHGTWLQSYVVGALKAT